MKKWIMMTVSLLVLSACGGEKSSDCGDGEAIEVSGADYCVYRQEVVVENGFECPSALPNLFQGGGVAICTGENSIDPQRIGEIRDRYRERDPSYGACQIDLNCASGEICLDQECVSQNGNNTNNTNNTNNSTNNGAQCQSGTDCDANQICESGVCYDPCGGFAGFMCPDPNTQFCDYAVDAMCGIADALGICRTRPEACDQAFVPVCGCDGQTYGNACTANQQGQGVMSDGECP